VLIVPFTVIDINHFHRKVHLCTFACDIIHSKPVFKEVFTQLVWIIIVITIIIALVILRAVLEFVLSNFFFLLVIIVIGYLIYKAVIRSRIKKDKTYHTYNNNETPFLDENSEKPDSSLDDSAPRPYARGRAYKNDISSVRPMRKPVSPRKTVKTGSNTKKRNVAKKLSATKKVKTAPAFGNYYLEVMADGEDLNWNENFLNTLPPDLYIPVLGQVFGILVKYTGIRENDSDSDIDEVHGRLAPVKFAVEVNTETAHISGLDEFEIDLDNGIYSISECMVLMNVLGQLMELE
jgi:hypothetical protein